MKRCYMVAHLGGVPLNLNLNPETLDMAITDHIAILVHSSLDVPRVNKLNPAKPASYFAQLAFPPTAGQDLQALAAAVAPGGNFAGTEVGVKTNGSLAKPIAGIAPDWFVVRSSTQYAPYVCDGAGAHLDQGNSINHSIIRAQFYAGKRVRASLAAYAWTHPATGRRGISFNLDGIMASEDSERLNIGQGKTVNAFAKHADPAKATTATASNPFGQQAQAHAAPTGIPAAATAVDTQQSGNPFAASAGAAAQSANPFAQQAGATANPFAQ